MVKSLRLPKTHQLQGLFACFVHHSVFNLIVFVTNVNVELDGFFLTLRDQYHIFTLSFTGSFSSPVQIKLSVQ